MTIALAVTLVVLQVAHANTNERFHAPNHARNHTRPSTCTTTHHASTYPPHPPTHHQPANPPHTHPRTQLRNHRPTSHPFAAASFKCDDAVIHREQALTIRERWPSQTLTSRCGMKGSIGVSTPANSGCCLAFRRRLQIAQIYVLGVYAVASSAARGDGRHVGAKATTELYEARHSRLPVGQGLRGAHTHEFFAQPSGLMFLDSALVLLEVRNETTHLQASARWQGLRDRADAHAELPLSGGWRHCQPCLGEGTRIAGRERLCPYAVSFRSCNKVPLDGSAATAEIHAINILADTDSASTERCHSAKTKPACLMVTNKLELSLMSAHWCHTS